MKTEIKFLNEINRQLYEDALQTVIAEKYNEKQVVTKCNILDLPLPYITYENWGKKVKE